MLGIACDTVVVRAEGDHGVVNEVLLGKIRGCAEDTVLQRFSLAHRILHELPCGHKSRINSSKNKPKNNCIAFIDFRAWIFIVANIRHTTVRSVKSAITPDSVTSNLTAPG